MASLLQKLWRGGYSLPMTFLGFFVFGSWVAIFIAAIVLMISYQLQLDRFGFIIALLILACYWLLTSVAVWRSASASIISENWMSRLEAFAARGIVLLLAAYALWNVYDGGARWLMQRVMA
jgi:hypothetical protein